MAVIKSISDINIRNTHLLIVFVMTIFMLFFS